jgi:Fe-S cluster assembly ATPase SufC
MEGRIVESGGPELVGKLEELGYDWIEKGANGAPAEHAEKE